MCKNNLVSSYLIFSVNSVLSIYLPTYLSISYPFICLLSPFLFPYLPVLPLFSLSFSLLCIHSPLHLPLSPPTRFPLHHAHSHTGHFHASTCHAPHTAGHRDLTSRKKHRSANVRACVLVRLTCPWVPNRAFPACPNAPLFQYMRPSRPTCSL